MKLGDVLVGVGVGAVVTLQTGNPVAGAFAGPAAAEFFSLPGTAVTIVRTGQAIDNGANQLLNQFNNEMFICRGNFGDLPRIFTGCN